MTRTPFHTSSNPVTCITRFLQFQYERRFLTSHQNNYNRGAEGRALLSIMYSCLWRFVPLCVSTQVETCFPCAAWSKFLFKCAYMVYVKFHNKQVFHYYWACCMYCFIAHDGTCFSASHCRFMFTLCFCTWWNMFLCSACRYLFPCVCGRWQNMFLLSHCRYMFPCLSRYALQ